MKKYVYSLLLLIALGSYGAYKYQHYLEIEGLTDMTNMDVLAQLEEDFKVCPIEKKPPLSEETQVLYNYAYYHDLHNMWNGQKGDEVWQSTLPYYRIAAANGDYKANVRLQYLFTTGRTVTEEAGELARLDKQLEQQLPAISYYQKYFYIRNQQGWKINKHEELVFLRKAAELGNREAQYELAEVIIQLKDNRTFERRKQLWKDLLICASKQGLGVASEELAIRKKNEYKYDEAVKIFHEGVKNGNSASASRLETAFHDKIPETNKIDFLDLPVDRERAIRYKMIGEYLFRKDYLTPKVPDLDEIVPLPPAPLPAWDGKIAFQRWYEGTPPAKPSDELMQKLAEHAGLDVNTGLPLKKSK